mmetsp:Transcript_2862/g.6625  ORF Transcript_2862/g.6625 Transcript_2862/m.6625 type:complete len:241 (+) Transcript_2862:1462-2184(+)
MAADVPMARAADEGSTELRFDPTYAINSTGLRPAGADMPSALGTCPDRMRVPTPVVKPAITDTGTSLATTPRRVTPDANCNPPVANVMKGRASRPCAWTAPTTSKLMAAAGPVTANVVPPRSPPATPETAAVTRPTSAGTPLARAIASDSGTAMQPTVIPADMSVNMVSELNMRFQSGTSDGMPKSNRKGLDLALLSLLSGAFLSSLLLLSSSFLIALVVVAAEDKVVSVPEDEDLKRYP